MYNRVSALFLGDLDQPLGDQRACKRGPQQVTVLVNCAHLERRDDEIIHKRLSQVLDVEFGCACFERFFLKPVQLTALSHIG